MLVKEYPTPTLPPPHQTKMKIPVLLLLLSGTCHSFVTQPPTAARRSILSPLYATEPTTRTLSHALSSALKKPSKTLAVAIEYSPANDASTTDGDLSTLSMQLRKIASSALITSDLHAAKAFVQEQATAQGNFPGPCPVIYSGKDTKEAMDQAVGVNAVVVDANNDDQSIDYCIDVIYKVSSPDEVMQVVDSSNGNAGECAFMVVDANNNKEDTEEILNAIPSGSVVICSLQSMQPDNAELERGKELKALGATTVLLERACVGDGEDIEYSTFGISGLTKKKSSTFNMSGLTGSTNGHFGGVASSTTTSWLRVKE